VAAWRTLADLADRRGDPTSAMAYNSRALQVFRDLDDHGS